MTEQNQHFRVRFGVGEGGVIKKRTLCTLSYMSIIVNDPLVTGHLRREASSLHNLVFYLMFLSIYTPFVLTNS